MRVYRVLILLLRPPLQGPDSSWWPCIRHLRSLFTVCSYKKTLWLTYTLITSPLISTMVPFFCSVTIYRLSRDVVQESRVTMTMIRIQYAMFAFEIYKKLENKDFGHHLLLRIH